MIVVTMTQCPPALRGDLTAWLLEVDTCVFVGHVSARVREELWKRIQQHIRTGRATMVYTARNEQRMGFYVHNAAWEPIDFDGLKLMLRPAPVQAGGMQDAGGLRPGFSNAARIQQAKRFSRPKGSADLPTHLIVLDLETTGLDPFRDQIVELGALEVKDGQILRSLQALIAIKGSLPPAIARLTGITDQEIQAQGQPLAEVLEAFLHFAGELPILSHNASFDRSFLHAACRRLGRPLPDNAYIDSCALARKLLPDVPNWKLSTLAAHLDIEIAGQHRSLDDCHTTRLLYDKLMELSNR